MSKEIRLGLPKGSLNNPSRVNTYEVLVAAGYTVRGYIPEAESRRISIDNDPEIKPFLIRPQSAPILLSRGMLDIAITGEDWVDEESVKEGQNGVRKIGELKYGLPTRLVLAVLSTADFSSLSDFFMSLKGREKPCLCFTEYVNLTRNRFMQNEVYRAFYGNQAPLVQIRSLLDGSNRLVQIINSDGVTEGFIRLGADIIADNTQKGDTLRDYGLKEIDQIMQSFPGLYAGVDCVGWKEKKALEIYRKLKGAVDGKEMFDVKFNIPLSEVEKIRKYLVLNGYCADEPTIVLNKSFAAVNIVIPRDKWPDLEPRLSEEFSGSAIVRNKIEQYIR